jgi:hypothetical protein
LLPMATRLVDSSTNTGAVSDDATLYSPSTPTLELMDQTVVCHH